MDTITSATLLEAIKNVQNNQAWNRFFARYQPLITTFAKRLGLDQSDADDVSQDTLLVFLQDYQDGKYDQEKGRLRSWLFGIAHYKIADIKRRRMKEIVIVEKTEGTGFLARIESPDEMERIWDEEWKRSILRTCLEEAAKVVSPQTVKAFEFHVLKEWTVENVAQHLGMSTNAVYIAKNRVLTYVRKVKKKMEKIW